MLSVFILDTSQSFPPNGTATPWRQDVLCGTWHESADPITRQQCCYRITWSLDRSVMWTQVPKKESWASRRVSKSWLGKATCRSACFVFNDPNTKDDTCGLRCSLFLSFLPSFLYFLSYTSSPKLQGHVPSAASSCPVQFAINSILQISPGTYRQGNWPTQQIYGRIQSPSYKCSKGPRTASEPD